MPTPLVPQKSPCGVQVEPGDYHWCTCGGSKRQPFCDGSHKGTGFTPLKVTITEAGTKYFCACKHTKNAPFCDGSHKTLP
ncbi:MAG: CDGSH iron-sulfur domain-containing protein [Acidimicrobiia bacterium]|nr:CDGSH iron-sulfur domain-containing protein [Acidimicrobiia bacterium]